MLSFCEIRYSIVTLHPDSPDKQQAYVPRSRPTVPILSPAQLGGARHPIREHGGEPGSQRGPDDLVVVVDDGCDATWRQPPQHVELVARCRPVVTVRAEIDLVTRQSVRRQPLDSGRTQPFGP